jgi:hypothetical protein
VAENDECREPGEHQWARLTRECPALLVVHVLRADVQVRHGASDVAQPDRRRADDRCHERLLDGGGLDGLSERNGLLDAGRIHLPVARHDRSTHQTSSGPASSTSRRRR